LSRLDLHGVRHRDVYNIVDSFINDIIVEGGNEVKCEIVTGHSNRMKELAREVLDEYKIEVLENPWNGGVLVIKL